MQSQSSESLQLQFHETKLNKSIQVSTLEIKLSITKDLQVLQKMWKLIIRLTLLSFLDFGAMISDLL